MSPTNLPNTPRFSYSRLIDLVRRFTPKMSQQLSFDSLDSEPGKFCSDLVTQSDMEHWDGEG